MINKIKFNSIHYELYDMDKFLKVHTLTYSQVDTVR